MRSTLRIPCKIAFVPFKLATVLCCVLCIVIKKYSKVEAMVSVPKSHLRSVSIFNKCRWVESPQVTVFIRIIASAMPPEGQRSDDGFLPAVLPAPAQTDHMSLCIDQGSNCPSWAFLLASLIPIIPEQTLNG